MARALDELAARLDALAVELGDLVKRFGQAVDSGDTYYLHGRAVRLRGLGEVQIVYFATDLRDGALSDLPEDREIVVNLRTGLPLAKKVRRDP